MIVSNHEGLCGELPKVLGLSSVTVQSSGSLALQHRSSRGGESMKRVIPLLLAFCLSPRRLFLKRLMTLHDITGSGFSMSYIVVMATNLGSCESISHRGPARFPYCSTFTMESGL